MDIRTLIFDVLGTVVDERGSIAAEVADAIADPDLARRVTAEWEQRLDTLMDEVRAGAAPWRFADELRREPDGQDRFDLYADDLRDLAERLA